ncbi:MAG: hypothetical protein LUF78_07575 [Clostridiales bacterium]|nr:hypothetical protein [Clostridiales bacterium]
MRSLLARLEALEKRSPTHLEILVRFPDDSRRIFSISEYEQRAPGVVFERIVGGGDLQEFDRLLDAMLGQTADISNNF